MFFFTVACLLVESAFALDVRSFEYYGKGQYKRDVSATGSPPYPTSSFPANPQPTGGACAGYWLENKKHQGLASFNTNAGSGENGTYQVFRNVKDFGAVGDGQTDDTAAIQRAISEGGRCAPGVCESSTTTPAVVYFPAGTYLISSSIIDYYYTQIIGNPNCLPTLLATPDFNISSGLGLIDGSPYQGSGPRAGRTGFGPTNTFFRQIRNLIFDMTQIPANVSATGLHWPTAQTTSLQNLVFNMNSANRTQHQGVFIEEGSGGFMTDLVFNGGLYGFNVGNQQFTTRNLTFNGCDTAVNQLWDWGWTYKSVSINNCRVGFNISAGGPSAVNVGSLTLFDSSIKNTQVGIVTSRTADSEPAGAGSVYLENVELENVASAVLGVNGTVLAGSSGAIVIPAWADGHRYLPNGPSEVRGTIDPSKRPGSLLDAEGKYFEKSKPQYGEVPLDQFLSVRDLGAKGDGTTDDTEALNAAVLQAERSKKILFIDAGYYRVTDTIYIPPGSRIVGEALASVIFAASPSFNDIENPRAVVKVAQPGEQGSVELSDLFVSTKGQQAGAILIEYNLASYGEVAGLWDVHTRIGGFAGSDLQTEQCPTTPNVTITADNLVQECIAAYMSMHVTKFGTGLYMENNWLWVADHDLDDARNNNTQITIYAGRGLLIESIRGVLWLYGTAVEHHVKYEYQFVDTRDIFMGQIQTETAYYQPNPDATIPFPEDVARFDPVFSPANGTNNADGWGLRILRSSNILGYGVGLYSFFNNYSTACSQVGAGATCQTRIFSVEGNEHSHDISIYNLNTVGATDMITRDGVDIASNVDNNSTFVDTINVFRISDR
ncbi:glycoside hydrolase family 55 protein [Aaosphaeria arxii CBS 175.79]|uniref:Glycoside hydrolase family 55 protein n=1 Tax=Aaosphaeria arxii CBS 175.79 TaxID=1450172 RepID=A0A6A5XTR4_9PLEO|nr:glycoside hydrolase family 55 protein [Aaosphaeria arxii CBS 175.79]KAF2016582.1 glycoside hydrolase family 55 protein [Aaosphaeria arxii CBS 175.79]